MKKLLQLLFLFIIAAYSAVQAQPTISSTDAIKAGDSYIIQPLVTTSLNASSAGNGGANQTWDFSALTNSGLDETVNAIDATTSIFYSSYYSATPSNVCENISGMAGYNYFFVSDTAQDFYGNASSGSYVTYSVPQKIIQYPFTYNNTFNSNFTGEGITTIGTALRTGNATVTADGYGTVKTPTGNYTNALRVKTNQFVNDNYGSRMYEHTTSTIYQWYVTGKALPVFTLQYDSTRYNENGDSGTFSKTTAEYSELSSATGIVVICSGFFPPVNIFPNPAIHSIFVSTAETVSQVSVANVLGQNLIAFQPDNTSSNNPIEISIADLPVGIYLCTVITSSRTVTQRIVKE